MYMRPRFKVLLSFDEYSISNNSFPLNHHTYFDAVYLFMSKTCIYLVNIIIIFSHQSIFLCRLNLYFHFIFRYTPVMRNLVRRNQRIFHKLNQEAKVNFRSQIWIDFSSFPGFCTFIRQLMMRLIERVPNLFSDWNFMSKMLSRLWLLLTK